MEKEIDAPVLIDGILMAHGMVGTDLMNASNEIKHIFNEKTQQQQEIIKKQKILIKSLFSIIKQNSIYIMAGQSDYESQLKLVDKLNFISKEAETILKEPE